MVLFGVLVIPCQRFLTPSHCVQPGIVKSQSVECWPFLHWPEELRFLLSVELRSLATTSSPSSLGEMT